MSTDAFIGCDATQLKTLARALRDGEPVLAREFHNALVRSADIVAVLARANAAREGLNDIGPVTPFSTTTKVGVRVGAGRKPHSGEAAAFENKGIPGTFRHPVFGNYDVWRPQQARPFLTPAAEAALPQVEEQVNLAVDIFSALVER